MGIDYDCKSFFGIHITYEQLLGMSETLGFDIAEYIYEEQLPESMEEYPNLYIGTASPYYDTPIENCIIFIGIGLNIPDHEENTYTIANLQYLIENWQQSKFIEFLRRCNIEYELPKLYCVPDIS